VQFVVHLDFCKVVARRAALELHQRAVCNLGAGISTGIANVAAEEQFLNDIVLTNEQSVVGGTPASGIEAGAGMNYQALIDQPCQFDFSDSGGLDLAFLSFAEFDELGNVNVSRFGDRIIGRGGFINISQYANVVVYFPEVKVGSFASSGGTQRLPRLVGLGYPQLLLATGKVLTGDEALAIGLVEQVADDADLMNVVMDMAPDIASVPSVAVEAGKRCILEGEQNGVEAGPRRRGALPAESRFERRSPRRPRGFP
jgi:Enoyl-CoA hydratase/isomerase